MSCNFFSSHWYKFMTSWKYWDATSAGNYSKIFSNNNTQLKMHSHLFTVIVLLQFMHVTILSPGTVATGLQHLSSVHAASTVRLVPANSGQHIFGFNLTFISSSWSLYFLITSSDKIGISCISSDTIAVVVGVVDNFLPKKFFRFKLWNLYFLPSSIDCVNYPHIVMRMSLVWSNKIASRRLLVLPDDWMVFFPGRSFIHPIISNILKFCTLMKSTFGKCFSL